jgi:hypothetical protein
MKRGKNEMLIDKVAREVAARFPDPIFNHRVRRRIVRVTREAMIRQLIEEVRPTHMATLYRIWRKSFADIRPKMTVSGETKPSVAPATEARLDSNRPQAKARGSARHPDQA